MKQLIIILAFMAASIGVNAQDSPVRTKNNGEFKTIFGGKSMGGYGSLGIGYTLIEDRPGVTVDARGGVVLGHSFAFGIGGAGFLNTFEYVQSLNSDISLAGGYGGIFTEFILFPRSRVHLSVPVLAGMGAIAATSFSDANSSNASYQNRVEETEIFMILEPGVELEFNFTRFFRMAGFFSYRITSDLDIEEDYGTPEALQNYSVGLRFKFGRF